MILPPLFVNPSENFENTMPHFSLSVIFYFFIAIFLYFQRKSELDLSVEKKSSINPFFKNIVNSAYILKTFGILVVTFSIINFLNGILGFSESVDFDNSNVFLVLITFFFKCFYEEMIYRVYFPEMLKSFFKFPHSDIIFEIFSVLIFAFSHRYLGYLSVLNAAIAGIALRLCFIKSKTVFTGYLSHFFYNSFVFILAKILSF